MQEGYRLHLSYHCLLPAKYEYGGPYGGPSSKPPMGDVVSSLNKFFTSLRKRQSSLVSESLLVYESSLGSELLTLDLGPLVSMIVDSVPKVADN